MRWRDTTRHIPLDLRLDEEVDAACVTLTTDIAPNNAVRQITVKAEGYAATA